MGKAQKYKARVKMKPYFKIQFKRGSWEILLLWEDPGKYIDIWEKNEDDELYPFKLVAAFSPEFFEEALDEFRRRMRGEVV